MFVEKHGLNIMLVQVLINLPIKYDQQPLINNNVCDIFITHYFFETVVLQVFFNLINYCKCHILISGDNYSAAKYFLNSFLYMSLIFYESF